MFENCPICNRMMFPLQRKVMYKGKLTHRECGIKAHKNGVIDKVFAENKIDVNNNFGRFDF